MSGALRARILVSIIFVIIVAVILLPISIPFPVSRYSRQYFEFVQSIPHGAVVGFMVGDMPWTRSQLQSSTVLTMVKLWEKGAKIVFWSDQALSGPILLDYVALAEALLGRRLKYGVDYVNLGYIVGAELGQAAFLKDIRGATSGVDIFGNRLDDLPIMRGVNSGADLRYGFANTSCENSEPVYIRQWQRPYGAEIATINCARDLAMLTMYLKSGQLKGTANGLLGSAEMEYLTGHLGSAYRQVMAVSFMGLYLTILIFGGNVFILLAGLFRRLR